MSICEWTTFDRIARPSSTTAAEVSSHEDSMPRIFRGSVLLGLRVLLEDPRLDVRGAALDLGAEHLDARLELEVAEAVGIGGLRALHDALVVPLLHQLAVLLLRHLDGVVGRDAEVLLPLLAVDADAAGGVVARRGDLEM